MKSLAFVAFSMLLLLSFETLDALPQYGVDLDSGAAGGDAQAGAGLLDGVSRAGAGAAGGVAKSEGAGLLREAAGGLLTVSSGARGGLSQASAGTREGVGSGGRVQALGGDAQSGAGLLGADGDSTSSGAGASGGVAQAAADTVGDISRTSAGSLGGTAGSGAAVRGKDGGLTNVGTDADGGIAQAAAETGAGEVNVNSGAAGGDAQSAAQQAGEEAPATGGDHPADTPGPVEPAVEDPIVVVVAPEVGGDSPIKIAVLDDKEDEPAGTPAVVITGNPSPNEEGKDAAAEDAEGESKLFSGPVNAFGKVLGKVVDTIRPITDQVVKNLSNYGTNNEGEPEAAPEAAPVDGEAQV